MAIISTTTFRSALKVYEHLCQPVCKAAGIQQGELDILLFLANHPGKNTAADIHKTGGMKQSMISVLVEKLVQGGYVERQSIPGDRRKNKLICTEKAGPVIEGGRAAQKKMGAYLTEGIPKEDAKVCKRVLATVEENIRTCQERILKGGLG